MVLCFATMGIWTHAHSLTHIPNQLTNSWGNIFWTHLTCHGFCMDEWLYFLFSCPFASWLWFVHWGDFIWLWWGFGMNRSVLLRMLAEMKMRVILAGNFHLPLRRESYSHTNKGSVRIGDAQFYSQKVTYAFKSWYQSEEENIPLYCLIALFSN